MSPKKLQTSGRVIHLATQSALIFVVVIGDTEEVRTTYLGILVGDIWTDAILIFDANADVQDALLKIKNTHEFLKSMTFDRRIKITFTQNITHILNANCHKELSLLQNRGHFIKKNSGVNFIMDSRS